MPNVGPRSGITSHELARHLLTLPDVPLSTTDGEYGYPEAFDRLPKTYEADHNEMQMLWMNGVRTRIRL